MTARELYEYALIELNKLEAPSLLLEDYNYFINKAVQQYINLVYAKLEVDQQSTDDIRVLKASAILKPKKLTSGGNLTDNINKGSLFGSAADEVLSGGMFKSSYYVNLPSDYMHLMNCIVEYTMNACHFKCYNKGEKVYFAARRLTPDMYTQIINNAYLRPMYKRPYYYLNNLNTNFEVSGDGAKDVTGTLAQYYHQQNNNLIDWGNDLATSQKADDRLVNLANSATVAYSLVCGEGEDKISLPVKKVNSTTFLYTLDVPVKTSEGSISEESTVIQVLYTKEESNNTYKESSWEPLGYTKDEVMYESDTNSYTLESLESGECNENPFVDSMQPIGDRLSNPSTVRLELRFGNDDGIFVPTALYIDYLKSPMYIRLTQEQINATLDYSQVLEFPDYVCFEIANIFVRLLMENASDPRLQSNIPINKTIPDPMAQAQQAQTRR